jgi:uncharacterized UBP type Zn finger protein
VPELSSEHLASLREIGFSEELCRNGLLLHRNQFERALEWLLEHADDPDAAEPLRYACCPAPSKRCRLVFFTWSGWP